MHTQAVCESGDPWAGAPDSGLKRYTTSTLGQLAFIGGRKRARALVNTRPLAAPNES